MFRLTAPKSGTSYRVFSLQDPGASYVGLPPILLAVPIEGEPLVLEADVFNDYQGTAIARQKPYRKLYVEGSLPVGEDLLAPPTSVSTPWSDDSIRGPLPGGVRYQDGFYLPAADVTWHMFRSKSYGSYSGSFAGFSSKLTYVRTRTVPNHYWDSYDPYYRRYGGSLEVTQTVEFDLDGLAADSVIRVESGCSYKWSSYYYNGWWHDSTTQEAEGSYSCVLSGTIGNQHWSLDATESHIGGSTSTKWNGTSAILSPIGSLVCVVGAEPILVKHFGLEYKSFRSVLTSSALSRMREVVDSAVFPAGSHSVWSSLQNTATQSSYVISNNMWMFVRDMANLKEDFQSLLDAGKKAYKAYSGFAHAPTRKAAKAAAVATANVYLPVKYGYGLTVSEAHGIGQKLLTIGEKYRRLFGTFQMRARQDVQSTLGSVKCCYLANVHLKDNAFSQLYGAIFNSGFYLTLKDAWDFIPYSFCVDWIVSVGDLVAAIDAKGYRANLDADAILHTTIFDSTVSQLQLWVDLYDLIPDTSLAAHVSFYDRQVSRTFDPTPIALDTPLAEGQRFSHFTEATALFVQRLG